MPKVINLSLLLLLTSVNVARSSSDDSSSSSSDSDSDGASIVINIVENKSSAFKHIDVTSKIACRSIFRAYLIRQDVDTNRLKSEIIAEVDKCHPDERLERQNIEIDITKYTVKAYYCWKQKAS